jgi:diguanylate cyclase (GGDEF)-like protein
MENTQAVRDIIVFEYFSCVLLAIIYVYSLMDRNRPSLKQSVFRISVGVSLVAICITIFVFHFSEVFHLYPRWMGATAASMLYIAEAFMISTIAGAMMITMFEKRYESLRFKTAVVVIVVFCILQILLVWVNYATGCLFCIDEHGHFITGPLHRIDLVFMIVAFGIIFFFYRLERKRAKKSFRLIYTLPVLMLIMGAYQSYYLHTVLTGTIVSVALLVLFIYGQQQRIHVDQLTEIGDREAFFYALERLATRGQVFRVVIVCLNKYKLVNNQFGQRTGDEFLRLVGSFFASLDGRIAAYRFSGVEFALVVTKMCDSEYEEVFSAIVNRFEEPWVIEAQTVRLNASFSDVLYPEHADGVDELIDSLEYAARLAKSAVPKVPVRFNSALRNEFGRRNYVINQMETALREDRFFLCIQPVYDCERKRFTGGEVLLRLNESNGRPIPPGEFIPIAIEYGIATELGLMVLEKTCQFLSENRCDEIGWLSVNISSQQYEFDETVRRLEELLGKYSVPPKCIKLEVTERVLLDDLTKARQTMDELRRQGVGVYLDDFGTGYSNLVNVMSLPFECVKIDKGLVRGISKNPKSYGLLQTVVNGLRSMNVVVLAEGVETQEEDEIVKQLGINKIQGYYYAHPMPSEEFVRIAKHASLEKSKPDTE